MICSLLIISAIFNNSLYPLFFLYAAITNILFILGWLESFGWLKSQKSLINLLENTFEVLNSFYPNFNIFIKPHYITDMNIVSSIIKKNNYKNIFVSYLHTGMLGKFCHIKNIHLSVHYLISQR